jgi:hypothetical protein
MSFMFFFPDVLTGNDLPITGGLAAVALFAVLIIKLTGDPDHNARSFTAVTVLLGLGAALYFIPYIFGVQVSSIATGTALTWSSALVSSTNPIWAVGIGYVSVALVAILGAYAVVYALRTGGQPEETSTEPIR